MYKPIPISQAICQIKCFISYYSVSLLFTIVRSGFYVPSTDYLPITYNRLVSKRVTSQYVPQLCSFIVSCLKGSSSMQNSSMTDLAQTRGLPASLSRKQKISFNEKWIYMAQKYSSFVRMVQVTLSRLFTTCTYNSSLSPVCTVLVQGARVTHLGLHDFYRNDFLQFTCQTNSYCILFLLILFTFLHFCYYCNSR